MSKTGDFQRPTRRYIPEDGIHFNLTSELLNI
jgi:hypothetical protein